MNHEPGHRHAPPPDALPHAGHELSPGETLRLAEAFRIFNQASEELSTAYTRLQGQVAELTSELAAANGALRQQYQEKAALTERLSLLLDALPAGVVVLDAEGRLVQINPAALVALGIPLTDFSWPDIERDQLQPAGTPDEYLVAAGRRLAVTVTPLDSAGGRIVLLHDITEAHRLKVQAERHDRLAAMGEMAAQLAHQLRTPLAAALLYAANLENPDLPTPTRINIAEKTVARLKHLERLIQDMLLFARGEVLGREAVNVQEMLDELHHTLEPLARSRHIDFSVIRAQDVLPTWHGNRKAVVGGLVNLLENALHATAAAKNTGTMQDATPGKVTLTADCDDNHTLIFRIRDNGCGMPPSVVSRLFEPFFTTRTEGTGLGLAIARGVIRAHQGEIRVESTEGVGTEFIVTLPLQPGQNLDTENP